MKRDGWYLIHPDDASWWWDKGCLFVTFAVPIVVCLPLFYVGWRFISE